MRLPALGHRGACDDRERGSKQAAVALTVALGITTRRRGSAANVLAILAAVLLRSVCSFSGIDLGLVEHDRSLGLGLSHDDFYRCVGSSALVWCL
jgi:hypothetical protein